MNCALERFQRTLSERLFSDLVLNRNILNVAHLYALRIACNIIVA